MNNGDKAESSNAEQLEGRRARVQQVGRPMYIMVAFTKSMICWHQTNTKKKLSWEASVLATGGGVLVVVIGEAGIVIALFLFVIREMVLLLFIEIIAGLILRRMGAPSTVPEEHRQKEEETK